MTIASAGNAETACLQVLREKGYTVKVYVDEDKENKCDLCQFRSTFVAEKDGESFSAESAMAVLGLVGRRESAKARKPRLAQVFGIGLNTQKSQCDPKRRRERSAKPQAQAHRGFESHR